MFLSRCQHCLGGGLAEFGCLDCMRNEQCRSFTVLLLSCAVCGSDTRGGRANCLTDVGCSGHEDLGNGRGVDRDRCTGTRNPTVWWLEFKDARHVVHYEGVEMAQRKRSPARASNDKDLVHRVGSSAPNLRSRIDYLGRALSGGAGGRRSGCRVRVVRSVDGEEEVDKRMISPDVELGSGE
nr:hypothetical protein Iba_chr04eCG17450 [Ipomoea batatas]